MENKKKGLFAGFGKVFGFTAEQTMKGKGFRLSSIGIGLLAAIICFAIPLLMAVFQKPEDSDKEDDTYNIEENLSDREDEAMDAVLLSGVDGLKETLESFLALCGYEEVKIEISQEENQEAFAKECQSLSENPLGIRQTEKNGGIVFQIYYSKEGTMTEEFAQEFAQSFQMYYEDMKYVQAGVKTETLELINMGVLTSVDQAGEEETNMGVMIARIVIPMIFSLVLFMITILQGQAITRTIMTEKSSKLMEVLLTSVRPYALIAGKIMAVATISVVQMAIWIAFGFAGYFAGCEAAKGIYPEYQNYIHLIVEMIQESGTGFHAGAIILAVLFTIAGFFMYCVWAGLIASAVDKVDDLSTAMSLFQIPVMIGFMVSYVGSALELKTLILVCSYVPVTSPFVMPTEVLTGNTGMLAGMFSFLLLIVFMMGMILLTGKIYKDKIFKK